MKRNRIHRRENPELLEELLDRLTARAQGAVSRYAESSAEADDLWDRVYAAASHGRPLPVRLQAADAALVRDVIDVERRLWAAEAREAS